LVAARRNFLQATQGLGRTEADAIAISIGLPEEFDAGRSAGRQPHALLAIVRFPYRPRLSWACYAGLYPLASMLLLRLDPEHRWLWLLIPTYTP
jgi:hypothetical protein